MIRGMRKRLGVPGLNTTSTADISFMLLIFFLVTTSMDVDKGMVRQLPEPEPEKQQNVQTQVDSKTLMQLHLTAGGKLLVNEKPLPMERLQQEVVLFVNRLGAKHLISIDCDREACYDDYFRMQNNIAMAYSQLRSDYARKHYRKTFSQLSSSDKDQVRKAVPQRIAESYAKARTYGDRSVSADAEEQKPDSNSAAESKEGGKP